MGIGLPEKMKAYADLGQIFLVGYMQILAHNRFSPIEMGPTNVGMLGSYEAFGRTHY